MSAGPAPFTPDDVCVVVPVHRGGQELDRALEGLLAADPAPGEIIVVSDGADRDDLRRAKRPGVKVLSIEPRSGPAAARNHGSKETDLPVVFFVDADVVVHPNAVAVVARQLATADAVIGSYDDAPTADNFLSQYKNLMNHHVHQHADREGFTFWAACGAIRRDALLAVGGFDADRYPEPSIEDIELGYRLRAAGYSIRVDPMLQATHLKRWTPWTLLRTEVRNRALPWSELILESGGFEDDLNIDRRGRAKVALTGALLLGLVASRSRIGRAAAALCGASLLALDRDLIAFYSTARGPAFAARSVPLLWLSYLYSGAAFTVALGRHLGRVRA